MFCSLCNELFVYTYTARHRSQRISSSGWIPNERNEDFYAHVLSVPPSRFWFPPNNLCMHWPNVSKFLHNVLDHKTQVKIYFHLNPIGIFWVMHFVSTNLLVGACTVHRHILLLFTKFLFKLNTGISMNKKIHVVKIFFRAWLEKNPGLHIQSLLYTLFFALMTDC